MNSVKRNLTFLVSISISMLVFQAYSSAQPNFEGALRESDRSMREQATEELVGKPDIEPERVEEAPEPIKTEGKKIFIKKVILTGNESFPQEHFETLIAEYENKELTFGELKILAREIEQDYLRKGVVCACFVPPQEVKDGLVTLQVVEAHMGNLIIKEFKYFDNNRVAYYWGLKREEILKYDQISKSLRIMNTNMDKESRATLYAGDEPGTTDVLITTKSRFPIHFIYSLDNDGVTSTGKYRQTFGFRHNNFLGLDDSLLGGYILGDHFNTIYAYHMLPISPMGTFFIYGFTRSNSYPKKDFIMYDMRSFSKNASVFMHQDLFIKDSYVGEVYGGLEGKDRVVYTKDDVLTKDRLRFLIFGTKIVLKEPHATTLIKPEFSQGINNLGALRKNEFSTRQAENTPTTIRLDLRHSRMIQSDIHVNLKFRGMMASEKLTSIEELPMGGINSIRGYPYGDYYADSGFYTNVELLVKPSFLPNNFRMPFSRTTLANDLTGVFFFDYGYGTKRGKIEGEQSKRRLASVGGGIRINAYNQAYLRLEWGAPLECIANLPFNEMSRSRFHMSLDFQDRLPETIDYIAKQIERNEVAIASRKILDKELKNKDSLFAKKVYTLYHQATTEYKSGNLEQASVSYTKLVNVLNSTYNQTAEYINGVLSLKERLKQHRYTADRFYHHGEYQKAKEIWQKIEEDAKIKPLTLDI